jgi:signal transduction histidine kinase
MRIRTNQQHLLALIDDVLNFAKVEAGGRKLDAEAVNVGALLDSLDALVRPDAVQRELELTWPACDPAMAVRADPVKLRQILINVIGNAIKFTPRGGRIALSVSKRADMVAITVTDTGIGIPADKIDRVFEPFFQVNAGTTREYSGVGLGLAISRDFARAMGGDITIRSLPDEGCEVTIELRSAENSVADAR